jgi:hypothetical protein
MSAALRAAELLELRHDAQADRPLNPAPFITISRQAGAGGRSLAQRLVRRLNDTHPGILPWTVWDNELVHKVAEESHLPEDLVASLEERRPSWLHEALAGLTFQDDPFHPDEFKVYRRVTVAIRALAQMGRVVMVGRGSAFVTRDLPGGIHLRLVAPLKDRVAHYGRRFHLSPEEAAAHVHQIDDARAAFYRRYWPGKSLAAEAFTATFNTAAVPEDRLVEAVVALIPPEPSAAERRQGSAAGRALVHGVRTG